MGKTGKWFKSLLSGKKDHKNANAGTNNHVASADSLAPNTTPVKEKRRWSFRRSSATAVGPREPEAAAVPVRPDSVAVNANEADAVVVVEPAAAEEIPLSDYGYGRSSSLEVVAAIKIQSVFRSYLATKALKALRGLVKIQALVRGHLVRKQAKATLRCMQALVTAQARARAQRTRAIEDGKIANHRQSTQRRNSQDMIDHFYYDEEDNVKIVEMDKGEFRSSSRGKRGYSVSSQQEGSDRMDNRMSTNYSPQQQFSPAPSAMTDMSPRTFSGYFEDYTSASPQCYFTMSKTDPSKLPFSFPRPDFAQTMSYDHPLYPNYMANTQSSRAKARSQSAPKQRPPEFERQPSRGRRASVEGRGIPKGVRMQRSSSQVGSAAQNYQYPWSIKLDKSTISLIESECGSNCSMLSNANYCRSMVSYNPRY